jgi:hypothetical protein
VRQFNPAVGILVQVAIHKAGTITPATLQQAPPPNTFQALVDTGATTTCISSAIAKALNLTPAGLRPMGSATHQAVLTNTYLVDLGLPLGTPQILWLGAFLVFEFGAPQNSPYQMLLGRDILCKGNLTATFDGHFSFAI